MDSPIETGSRINKTDSNQNQTQNQNNYLETNLGQCPTWFQLETSQFTTLIAAPYILMQTIDTPYPIMQTIDTPYPHLMVYHKRRGIQDHYDCHVYLI